MTKKIMASILALGISFFVLRWLLMWWDSDLIIVPQESHIVKSSEIQPFLAGRTGFRGIHWDLDTSEISFAFPTSLTSAESYFNTIHLAAQSNGWRLWEIYPLKRIYKRTEKRDTLKATLLYNPKNSEVTCHLEIEY